VFDGAERKENANNYYEAIIDLIMVYAVLVKNDTEKILQITLRTCGTIRGPTLIIWYEQSS